MKTLWLARCIGGLFTLLLSTQPASALPLGTEAEFDATLKLVEKTMGPGRWKKAREMLLAALEANKDQRFVLYRAVEIERALQLCDFSIAYEAPEPSACVSGELLAYSPSNGQIEMRYRNDPAGRKVGGPKLTGKPRAGEPIKFEAPAGYDFSDFRESKSKISYHALEFAGPFTIEVKGKAYPHFDLQQPTPVIFVCMDFGQYYRVSFGYSPITTNTGTTWVPAKISHLTDGEMYEDDESEPQGSPGAPYHLKVAVANSSITVYRDGKQILTAKKPASQWGGFAFANCPEATEVLVKGKVQSSFVQGAVDKATQKQWGAFEENYAPEKSLPAWFVEKTKERTPPPPDFDAVFPGADHPKRAEHLTRVKSLFAKEELTEPQVAEELERLKAYAATDITDELRQWLCARVLYWLDAMDEALKACEKVRTLDADFVPARIFRARLLEEMDRRADAILECRATIESEPTLAEAYSGLATLLLRDDKADEARTVVRAAIDAGVPADELEEISATLMRCVKGPSWPKPFEYKTEHYHVSSDISQEMCFKAATLLEKFYRKYNARLQRIAGAAKKRMFRVFLFAGQEGYQAYMEDLIGERVAHTNGLYSGVVKQLLIWNLPDTDNMLRTIRHEGFHQYMDQIVADAPRWLDEGMAEYFEGSKLVKGSWSDGELNEDRIETLRDDELMPLKRFLWLSPGAFMDDDRVSMNYAQAWVFVHFLMHGGNEHKKRFEKLFDALVAGDKPNDAVQKAFGDADFKKLDQEFRTYVRGLL